MNNIIILNWYHYDLNYKIINYKLKKYKFRKQKAKNEILNRITNDYKLKIKKD